MTHMDDHKKTQPRNRSEHTFTSRRVFIRKHRVWLPFCVDSSSLFSGVQKQNTKKNRWALIRLLLPLPKKTYQKQETGIIFPPNDSSKCSSLTSQKGSQERETSLQLRRPFANERFCNEWFCLPESPAGLFSLWNAIAPRDTPLSLHHLGTSREQRAASAEQTARRPHRLTTILPTALSAGCHDSVGWGGGDSRNQNITPIPKQFPKKLVPAEPWKTDLTANGWTSNLKVHYVVLGMKF